MIEPFTLDLTVPAESIARGKPVCFEVHLNEAEQHLLCERFILSSLKCRWQADARADCRWMLGIKRRNQRKVTQECVVSGQPVESPIVIELEERFVYTLSDQFEINAMEVDVGLL